jgi:predicted GTPase
VIAEVSELGFKEIHYVSAEHGNGVLELMQRINQCIPERLRDEVKQRKANRLKKFDKILR